jgi:hypothetical protein
MRKITALLGLLAAAPLAAQDDATALALLVDRAEAVAVVRTLRVDSADPVHLRVLFAVETSLRGAAAGTLELREPRSRGCGRALHGLVPGQRFVACLRRQDDSWALCAGTTRALPQATAGVIEHVRTLLDTDLTSRRNVLFAALTQADARVRGDAALTLPLLGGLEAADASQRSMLLATLRATEPAAPAYPALLGAAARLQLHAAIDVALPAYLAADADDRHARLYADAMLRIGAEPVATRVAAQLSHLSTPTARLRAVQLLLETQHEAAKAPLLALLRGAGERGVQLQACVGLLRLGLAASQLVEASDRELVTLAEQAATARPKFRSIRVE